MTGDRPDPIARSEAVETVCTLASNFLACRSTSQVSIESRFEGRTLATDIVAETDIPAQSYATMDGYAVDARDDYPLSIRETEVFPEDDPPTLGEGETVRIATGAPVPPEANAVLKVEEGRVEDGELTGPALTPGTYVYERGSNVRAGEQLFTAGERLSAKDAIFLRDLGYESVELYDPLSVGLLATGSEIHAGRIADLDSPMLASLTRSWGHEVTIEGSVPDEYDCVVSELDALATKHDVVMTTGGTSVGKKDYVIRALRELGDVLFHRVALRPGKPIAVARLADHDAVVFAIPGKPVGAHAVTTLVARPFFTGRRDLPTVKSRAACSVTVPTPGFEYAIPVTLDAGEATPLGHRESSLSVYDEMFDPSVLSSSTRATRADGFVLTETGFDADEQISVVPYGVVE